MDKFNLKLAKFYDVDYTLTSSICKNGVFVSNKTTLTAKNVMFYRSTDCYYIFYAKISDKMVRIKKSNVLAIREI